MKRTLYVDPGLGGTGWAYFDWLMKKSRKPEPPTATGVIHSPTSERWDNRVWSVCREFAGVLSAVNPEEVVLEMSALWSGSAKSYASATHHAKGEVADLFKLTFLIGGLASVAREYTNKIPTLISPQDWKGQLPKNVVISRLESAFGKKYRDHEADAVGMGLAAQGGL